MSQPKPMRQIFGETLVEIGKSNERLVVLDGDCSSSTRTVLFGQAYPERFFNCGIAEANMVSIAAGFAAAGFVPVASTFAFLIACRAGDQVRSQIAHSRLNVKLAGGYSGLSDFADGSSHQSVADIAIMRALPNMTVIAPGDSEETIAATRAAIEYDGPVFLRLVRSEVGKVIDADEPFVIGKARLLRAGEDVSILSTGAMVAPALEGAALLAAQGIFAEVLHIPTIKPLDREAILRSVRKTGAVVTIEDHNVMGGFGSAIAELTAGTMPCPVEILGIGDRFGQSGTLALLYEHYGLSAAAVARGATTVIERKAQTR